MADPPSRLILCEKRIPAPGSSCMRQDWSSPVQAVVYYNFHYGFLAIIHLTASVGTVAFIILILRESGAARELASLAFSGYEKAGSA